MMYMHKIYKKSSDKLICNKQLHTTESASCYHKYMMKMIKSNDNFPLHDKQ